MVRWPKGKELVKYSGAVLLLLAFFGVYFYALDLIFAYLKGLVS